MKQRRCPNQGTPAIRSMTASDCLFACLPACPLARLPAYPLARLPALFILC